nr:metallopeptidase family protein [Serinibacter salmoneus]
MLAPGTPAQRTRAELFDEEVLGVVEHLERRWAKELRGVEFGIEDVPPSDPAPWEHEVALGRCFAADRVAGLPARVVIYRRPVEARAEGRQALRDLLREVIVEHVAELLGRPPEIIDP